MNNSIRITSGTYRGRKILAPGGKTHPMGERERLALFNMISDFLPGARILDVFSGSGALGIEALSRGAEEVIFVENNKTAFKTIQLNLKTLAIDSRNKVLPIDAYHFLEKTTEKWDIVIADPPYEQFDPAKIQTIAKLINQFGILALSHPGSAPTIPELELTKTRSYAGANISIYTKPSSQA